MLVRSGNNYETNCRTCMSSTSHNLPMTISASPTHRTARLWDCHLRKPKNLALAIGDMIAKRVKTTYPAVL